MKYLLMSVWAENGVNVSEIMQLFFAKAQQDPSIIALIQQLVSNALQTQVFQNLAQVIGPHVMMGFRDQFRRNPELLEPLLRDTAAHGDNLEEWKDILLELNEEDAQDTNYWSNPLPPQHALTNSEQDTIENHRREASTVTVPQNASFSEFSASDWTSRDEMTEQQKDISDLPQATTSNRPADMNPFLQFLNAVCQSGTSNLLTRLRHDNTQTSISPTQAASDTQQRKSSNPDVDAQMMRSANASDHQPGNSTGSSSRASQSSEDDSTSHTQVQNTISPDKLAMSPEVIAQTVTPELLTQAMQAVIPELMSQATISEPMIQQMQAMTPELMAQATQAMTPQFMAQIVSPEFIGQTMQRIFTGSEHSGNTPNLSSGILGNATHPGGATGGSGSANQDQGHLSHSTTPRTSQGPKPDDRENPTEPKMWAGARPKEKSTTPEFQIPDLD